MKIKMITIEDTINMLDFSKKILEYYANPNNYPNIDKGEQARNALKIIDITTRNFDQIKNFENNNDVDMFDFFGLDNED